MALIDDWIAASREAVIAVAKERELRNKLIEANSSVGPLHSGVENIPAWGGIIKIEHKLDYKVTAANEVVETALDKIEASMKGGNIIAERLFRVKYELSVTEYKLLEPEQKKLVDDLIEIKPASKSVKFVPNVA